MVTRSRIWLDEFPPHSGRSRYKPEEFLSECKRVLSKEGILIISTPNGELTPPFGKHPCHVKEFSVLELHQLLTREFSDVQIFGSRFIKRCTINKVEGSLLALGGKVIDTISREEGLKWQIRKFILHETVLVLKDRISEEVLDKKVYEPIPLSNHSRNKPRILFAIARIQERRR